MFLFKGVLLKINLSTVFPDAKVLNGHRPEPDTGSESSVQNLK